MSRDRQSVAVVIGTRPEAVKLAPVIRALAASKTLRPVVLATSQHRHMVEPVLERFGLSIDQDLEVMRRNQSLGNLSGRLISRLARWFERHPVRAVLVQGDTSSALFGALAAFYHRIPVGHVEAGLRTGDRYAPFPEEMNRTLVGSIATWHFAPTEGAARRLRGQGASASTIHVTGNTVVDALRWMAPRCSVRDIPEAVRVGMDRRSRLILVTCHRRESLGAPMAGVASAVARVARGHPEARFVFPLHPNPAVRRAMRPVLERLSNVHLLEPLGYDAFLACLKRAWLVWSDSGGVQEEATALGKPVLVLRDKTERPEGVRAGALKLVGTDPERIVRVCARLWRDPAAHAAMCGASDVFGDGRAAMRIVRLLEAACNRRQEENRGGKTGGPEDS